ncbi:UNVERIFIED_CONTAM: hypothetical protein Sindi_1437800 [Sesamum indicum]
MWLVHGLTLGHGVVRPSHSKGLAHGGIRPPQRLDLIMRIFPFSEACSRGGRAILAVGLVLGVKGSPHEVVIV